VVSWFALRRSCRVRRKRRRQESLDQRVRRPGFLCAVIATGGAGAWGSSHGASAEGGHGRRTVFVRRSRRSRSWSSAQSRRHERWAPRAGLRAQRGVDGGPQAPDRSGRRARAVGHPRAPRQRPEPGAEPGDVEPLYGRPAVPGHVHAPLGAQKACRRTPRDQRTQPAGRRRRRTLRYTHRRGERAGGSAVQPVGARRLHPRVTAGGAGAGARRGKGKPPTIASSSSGQAGPGGTRTPGDHRVGSDPADRLLQKR